jgi:glycosyltransferase involved in cell wall biosynthesis
MTTDGIYVVITPVRNEEGYIGGLIQAMLRQTCTPAHWVIVDDGSCDGTAAVIDAAAALCKWISTLHRADRGHRAAGGGVMEAFYAGYALVKDQPWDFIVKLDGDLTFDPDYFACCLEMFARDRALGIGGGTICRLNNGAAVVDSPGDPPFHVRGATKIYRRACWERIGPLVTAPGWDTIDEVRANFHGWRTRTFPTIQAVQHRPTGEADGRWRNALKNGLANYMTGYHPIFMLAKCLRRALHGPQLVEAVALGAGFCSGYLRGIRPVCGPAPMRYLRREQIRRLLLQPSIYS